MDSVLLRDTGWKLAELSVGFAGDQAGHILTRNAAEPKRLREAVQEFEGYFIGQVMKVMRDTVPTGLLANKAGRLFFSLYDEEIGRLAAQAGGLGLAHLIESHYAQKSLESQDKKVLKSEPNAADTQTEQGDASAEVVLLPHGSSLQKREREELSDAYFRPRAGERVGDCAAWHQRDGTGLCPPAGRNAGPAGSG